MHFNITPISYALFFFAMESSIQSSNDGRNKNLIRIKFYSFFLFLQFCVLSSETLKALTYTFSHNTKKRLSYLKPKLY